MAAVEVKGYVKEKINALIDNIIMNTIDYGMKRWGNYVTAEKVQTELLDHSKIHEPIFTLLKHNDDVKRDCPEIAL